MYTLDIYSNDGVVFKMPFGRDLDSFEIDIIVKKSGVDVWRADFYHTSDPGPYTYSFKDGEWTINPSPTAETPQNTGGNAGEGVGEQ